MSDQKDDFFIGLSVLGNDVLGFRVRASEDRGSFWAWYGLFAVIALMAVLNEFGVPLWEFVDDQITR